MNPAGETVQTLRIDKDVFIAAAPEIVWESILQEIGTELHQPDGKIMPMKLEAKPGGLWLRDAGEGKGHFWGNVQVIKPPTLLELCGPMFMSYPAVNHVQYRLTAERDGTRMKFTHRGIGTFEAEHIKGVDLGWSAITENIRKLSEQRASR
jgi:uncharacterized protein YndB with AHSA1/START domain